MKNALFFLVACFAAVSCKTEREPQYPDVSGIEVDITIQRLDRELRSVASAQEMDSLLRAEPAFAEEFLRRSAYPDPRILSSQFYQLVSDSTIDSLFLEIERIFGDLQDVEAQFETAFRHIKYYYPEFQVPQVKTVATGIMHDMHLSDSLIILGLDYYLGSGGKYLPDIPDYIAKRYQKEYMTPQCVMLISTWYNANDQKDQTALADMIFYGKAYYFTKMMIPHVNDSLITGYSGTEMSDIREFEDVIWAGLLENEALYETNHVIKEKFLGERPKTYEIGEKCPGRIGRWVGYRIVTEYMARHPEVTLPQLMANPDAQAIFNQSGYRPK